MLAAVGELDRLEVTLIPSADAPAISFNDEARQRVRELRRRFLVRHGIQPHAGDEFQP